LSGGPARLSDADLLALAGQPGRPAALVGGRSGMLLVTAAQPAGPADPGSGR
jgi:hypothetical protein